MIIIVYQIFYRLRGGSLFNPEGRRANSIFNRQEKDFLLSLTMNSHHIPDAQLRNDNNLEQAKNSSEADHYYFNDRSQFGGDEGDLFWMKLSSSNF